MYEGSSLSTRWPTFIAVLFGFMGVQWHLIVDLIGFSLMTNDVHHSYFISLEKCLLRPSARFTVELSFYYLSSKSTLYTLSANLLSDL